MQKVRAQRQEAACGILIIRFESFVVYALPPTPTVASVFSECKVRAYR